MLIFDRQGALKALGRESILQAVVACYLQQLEEQRASLGAAQGEQLGEIAHSLKGGFAVLHAVEAQALAQELERLCLAGRWEQALGPGRQALDEAMVRLAEVLRG